ncbi:MAG: TadE/TadG family type IV pilus assembly protein [Novosphingobium meiothermophilum]
MKPQAALPQRKPARRMLRRLRRDRSGVSVIEFALVLPLFVTLGMYGAEIAWMNVAAMQASQVAVALADNASRIAQTDNTSVTPTISAADVNSVLTGALLEGSDIGIDTNGRVILSSVEVHPVTGKQYIHWQQCKGPVKNKSKLGNPDPTGLLNTVVGNGVKIGKATVKAPKDTAMIVAEVWFNYNGLFGDLFVQPFMMHEQAAVIVRDNRNTTVGLVGSLTSNSCS